MKKLFTVVHFSLVLIGSLLLSCKSNSIPEDASPIVSEEFSETWKFHAGEGVDSLWFTTNYDDSKWLDVSSKINLKDKNIALDNHYGWYRKSIQFGDSLRDAIKRKGAIVLHLGKIAACDEVYMNGKLVAKTGDFPDNYKGYFDTDRNYLVSAEDLNLEGTNLIAIKFHDGWSNSGGFIGDADLSISSAETKDKVELITIVGDSDFIFTGNNPVKIAANIKNKNKWNVDGRLYISLTTDDYQPIRKDSFDISVDGDKDYVQDYVYENPSPGFYRFQVEFKRGSEQIAQRNFNVGYEPEKIKSPLDHQSDFKAFWDNNLRELAKVSPNYQMTHIPEASQLDYDMYLVKMNSFGGETIQGYYAKPKKEGVHPVIVEYMGYGSQPYYPNQTWDGFAYFVLSVRGQALNQPANKYGTWITFGLDNKDDYYYRGAFLDVVRAIDFVSSRPEIDPDKIAVRGGSQGGALSFVAASLDKRVKVAAPNIPFLSDYPDYFKIAPWPKSDFDNYMKDHPEAKWSDVYQLLSYFDIKNLAQWISCPLIMGIGVQDNVCPPHINFAAYNQVKSNKNWMAFPEFGHSVGKEFNERAMALFRETLKVEKI